MSTKRFCVCRDCRETLSLDEYLPESSAKPFGMEDFVRKTIALTQFLEEHKSHSILFCNDRQIPPHFLATGARVRAWYEPPPEKKKPTSSSMSSPTFNFQESSVEID